MRLSNIALAVTALYGTGPFNPRALFANGEQGWVYDPSDFNRYMGALGPELVTNGDFSNGTTGWSGSGSAVLSVVGGKLKVENGATLTAGASQTFATVPGATYKWTYYSDPATSGGAVIRVREAVSLTVISTATRTTAGTYEVIFTATSTSTQVQTINSSNTLGLYQLIDNISVKELTAIDTATMFQDAAGTTPVTAMEQPLGLQLDLKNGYPTPGSELWGQLSTFNSQAEAVAAGYSFTNCTFNPATKSIVFSGGSAAFNFPSTGFVVGRSYQILFSGARTSGVIVFQQNFVTAATYSGFPSTTVITMGAGGFRFSTVDFVGSISAVSAREIPGNHRFQTTSANRPVVSARVNLLTKTEDFSDASWTKSGSVPTAGATDPSGTTTAWTLTASTNNAETYKLVTGLAASSSVLQKVYVKRRTGTGAIQLSVSGSTFTPIPVTDSWDVYSLTENSSAGGGAYFDIRIVTAGDAIDVWHPDLRPANIGVGLPAYQRVNTSTDYDTAGFPVYIKPNGSNQFMVTNSINFSATDKITVWAGVRKLSDAAQNVVAEFSSAFGALNNGSFTLQAPYTTIPGYAFNSRGTVTSSGANAASGYAAPITNVLTGVGDIAGDVATLRVNGTQAATSTTDQGTGNYGNYPAYFYARAGTSLFFSGHDYGSICRGAASTAGEITSAETWINQRTKAY